MKISTATQSPNLSTLFPTTLTTSIEILASKLLCQSRAIRNCPVSHNAFWFTLHTLEIYHIPWISVYELNEDTELMWTQCDLSTRPFVSLTKTLRGAHLNNVFTVCFCSCLNVPREQLSWFKSCTSMTIIQASRVLLFQLWFIALFKFTHHYFLSIAESQLAFGEGIWPFCCTRVPDSTMHKTHSDLALKGIETGCMHYIQGTPKKPLGKILYI